MTTDQLRELTDDDLIQHCLELDGRPTSIDEVVAAWSELQIRRQTFSN
jgi:hypothetical protein